MSKKKQPEEDNFDSTTDRFWNDPEGFDIEDDSWSWAFEKDEYPDENKEYGSRGNR